jgi:hypothetical protein
MNTYAKLGLSALFTIGMCTPGCTILGVEPDEIDLADETGTGLTASTNSEGGDGDGDTTSNGTDSSADAGDGDGDPSTGPGDGDGDPGGDGDGDGDGDGAGDGDGDAGDGDAGDGDGDGDSTGDGDGDRDPGLSCVQLEPIPVEETENEIDIPNVMSSFEGSCGTPGPDEVFSFTATSDATYEFTLASDELDGVLYLVEGCNPLAEIACEAEGQSIMHDMLVGEVVYIIVDSSTGPGAATLTIAAI